MSFAELEPAQRLLASVPFPWGFAGGWAIDLFLGCKLRDHSDIDIAVLRRDQAALFGHFPGWRWQAMRGGQPAEWTGIPLDLPIHELWAFGPNDTRLEFLLNDADGQDWHFRRDTQVTAPLARLFVQAGPHPALAPEIALLYKAKTIRPKDDADFAVCAPRLPEAARKWLRDALDLAHPGHRWTAVL